MRGYCSHLIFNELDKFDVEISVVPNGPERYMAFFLNKNLVFVDSMQFMNSSFDKLVKNLSDEDFKYLVFVDSMQFMNSSLDKLVKNLSDEDFKYLVEEFGSENLELLKQKNAYPYEYNNSFERFNLKKWTNW